MKNFKRIICCILLLFFIMDIALAEYKIYVNTKKCKVYVYELRHNKWKVKKSERCCIGKNNKTPKGEFKIKSKREYFKKGDKYYDYACFFKGNYGFHTVPRVGKKYDNSSLGKKQSAGCVRLTKKLAKWIYENCPKGTKVIIE